MKKNLFLAIATAMVCCLTSCGYQVKVAPIDKTDLSFVSALDAKTNLEVWGVQRGQNVLIETKYQNIKFLDSTFICTTDKGEVLLDITGKDCFAGLAVDEWMYVNKEFNQLANVFSSQTAEGKRCIYLIATRAAFGPNDENLLTQDFLIYKNDGKLGVMDWHGKEITPACSELIQLVVKNKDVYFIGVDKEANSSVLYKTDGTVVKKLSPQILKKYTLKKESKSIEGYFQSSVARL